MIDTIASFEEALKLARQQARIFHASGHEGFIFPKRSQGRVELLAVKGRSTIHLTFHPGGLEVELLPTGSLNKARALIEA